MLLSLALIFLLALALGSLGRKLRLPPLVGMLFTGLILGPYVLDLIDPSILGISAELRQLALIIILLRAGLSLDLKDLRKVGRPALLLSFVPASFEIAAYVLLAPRLLGLSLIEAAVMGAVLSAVSPAVVVPRMIRLIDGNLGTDEGVPQMILAGASMDDIYVIVLFSSFLNMLSGGSLRVSDLAAVPVSIVTGSLLGALTGLGLAFFFNRRYEKKRYIRNSVKILIILAFAALLMTAEKAAAPYFALSGLLAVVGMAMLLKLKCPSIVSSRLNEKLSKLWLAAEILLFVLVGAAVDIRYTLKAGPAALLLIVSALLVRSLGVLICLIRTPLSPKERLFCVFAYLPKATVQAAIGSIPLGLGLACGPAVLSAAVLGILLTAPLGAFAIDLSAEKLLQKAGPVPDSDSLH